jgi:thiamine biosynthesis lipoprotein
LIRYEETRSLMDTFITIIVYSPNEAAANEAIDAAFARMEEIEKIASIYDEEAEAFQLNQDGSLDAPSDDLIKLIDMSVEYGELTGGCFDITVQPLLDLWQYNPDAEKQFWELEESAQLEQINETFKLIGFDKITVEDDSISFAVEGMKITLGGIAKGYAADEALVVLKNKGIRHALVDAGGDLATLGSKPGGEPWLISLVNPDDTSQSLATFLFSGKSVATSGNYERYFDPDKEAGHILDPKTGYSANECISVTIIAENCTQADILATAVFVMGSEDGLEFVESLDGVECLVVDSDRIINQSSGLSAYLE